MDEPVLVNKLALEVTPYEHGIWCAIADGRPFVNTIVLRRWSENGEKIHFMLDTHNFLIMAPDEEMEVVEKPEPFYTAAFQAERLVKDAEKMRTRPGGDRWRAP
jgi:hypothetical protein